MRVVVKIGSSILTGGRHALNARRMNAIADAVSEIMAMGNEAVIVSSGAVAAGMKKLGLKSKPKDIQHKQAAAAVGQSSLMWAYERCFNRHGIKAAQVLLTRDGLEDRAMYINAKNTLHALLSYGVVPIVNENDTVAVDEIKFGDNDQLAAVVSSLIEADRLIILSDVEGLYDKDPSVYGDAKIIGSVSKITDVMLNAAGMAQSGVGTGGMYSKLLAAKKAVLSGITVNIINGSKPSHIVSIIKGLHHGTLFDAAESRLSARKGWIAFGSRVKGALTVDDGARHALINRQKSLLPSGVIAVSGVFEKGDTVHCMDKDGLKIARGLVNYSSDEIKRVMGRKTSEVEIVLGYKYSDEVIHRDNMVVMGSGGV